MERDIMNPLRFKSNFLNAVVLAAPALLAAVPAAHAEGIYVDRTAAPIPVLIGSQPPYEWATYLNLVSGAIGNTQAAVPGWDLKIEYGGGSGAISFVGDAAPNGVLSVVLAPQFDVARPLNFGRSISATDTFVPGFVQAYDFQNPGERFLGLKFFNEVTGVSNYGWLQVLSGALIGGFPASILGYGYENAGRATTAGAGIVIPVPEAEGYAVMLVGFAAVGLASRRRRIASAGRT
jgi:hypothetical protein